MGSPGRPGAALGAAREPARGGQGQPEQPGGARGSRGQPGAARAGRPPGAASQGRPRAARDSQEQPGPGAGRPGGPGGLRPDLPLQSAAWDPPRQKPDGRMSICFQLLFNYPPPVSLDFQLFVQLCFNYLFNYFQLVFYLDFNYPPAPRAGPALGPGLGGWGGGRGVLGGKHGNPLAFCSAGARLWPGAARHDPLAALAAPGRPWLPPWLPLGPPLAAPCYARGIPLKTFLHLCSKSCEFPGEKHSILMESYEFTIIPRILEQSYGFLKRSLPS